MPHSLLFNAPKEIHAAVGQELLVTEWLEVTQARIDAFAQATGDHQWIHVDPERAARESPYGRTIAHGFLTLSLLGQWYEEYMTAAMPFYDLGLNYGLNKVRFTNTVPVGSHVRARVRLTKAEDIAHGVQLTYAVTVEIEGAAKPACVVESVVRRLAGAVSSSKGTS
jgi:acyl dehydratase